VDPSKVVVILNTLPPTRTKHLHLMLGHTEYYHRFIIIYESITVPLAKLLKNSEAFWWTIECDKAFDILKEKLSTTPILIYPNWEIEFHVHVDASGISLGSILVQPREGNIDHLLAAKQFLSNFIMVKCRRQGIKFL
jgi:hypothetical protein